LLLPFLLIFFQVSKQAGRQASSYNNFCLMTTPIVATLYF
jgi:hypothetical protein